MNTPERQNERLENRHDNEREREWMSRKGKM
jgi:hypothetical protein